MFKKRPHRNNLKIVLKTPIISKSCINIYKLWSSSKLKTNIKNKKVVIKELKL